MQEKTRPNPEDLLKAIEREEKRMVQGRLKIFLGMAAGVGKTYAMLEDAQISLREKIQVVVGIVNTHGRQDTAKLLEGLPIIAPKIIEYKGNVFEELDLEAVLLQKPDLVLVDELAHTNIPGATHEKRWQDVEVILDNGIDVATTLNVQHIESLKDIVETITGVTIRETVPDGIVERSVNIELIDLSPEELLKRLEEGKIYLGSQVEIARAHFFQEDRLTALRELSLRFVAEKVDHDLRNMVSNVERRAGWKPRERLLVAISHSPHSKKLIRTTKRLAYLLDADWIAAHVDNGTRLDTLELEQLEKNLALARTLGAEVLTTQDPDITDAIERIARQKQVTQIIIGRPIKKGFVGFGFLQRFALLDRLATECIDIDVHVIAQAPDIGTNQKFKKKSKKRGSNSTFLPYFLIFCSVLVLTGVNMLVEPYVGYKIVGFIFLIGILLSSLIFKKWPTLVGALLFGVIWDYFFIPPIKTFVITSKEDTILVVLYMATAIATGILSDRARQHKEMLLKREQTSEALYEIVREIASTPTSDDIVRSVTNRLNGTLPGRSLILIRPLEGELEIKALSDPKEKEVALWVCENGKEAGNSTSIFPLLKSLYIPVNGYKEMMGVLIYSPINGTPSTDEKNVLYAVGQQLGYYLERHTTEERTRKAYLLKQIEMVYASVRKNLKQE